MKKFFVSVGIALLTVPSLCYYVTKYYIDRTLNFEESGILLFTIICSLIIFGLLLGCYNAFQNFKLHKEISELKNIIEEFHYENLEYHNNNREIILDLEKD